MLGTQVLEEKLREGFIHLELSLVKPDPIKARNLEHAVIIEGTAYLFFPLWVFRYL